MRKELELYEILFLLHPNFTEKEIADKIQFYQDQFEHKPEFELPDRIMKRQFWQFQSNSLQINHNNFLSLKIKRQVQSGRPWVVTNWLG